MTLVSVTGRGWGREDRRFVLTKDDDNDCVEIKLIITIKGFLATNEEY